MADNYTQVSQGFRILLGALAPYIARELKTEFDKDWWHVGVIGMLYDNQKLNLPTSGNDATLVATLDIICCLRLLDVHWGNVFRKKLSIDHRTWAKELVGIRNRLAHLGGKDFSDDDTWRALDTMLRLAKQIAPEEAEKIRRLFRPSHHVSAPRSTGAVETTTPPPPLKTMTLKEKILHTLSLFPGQTDAALAKRFGVLHQSVNQTCRTLESQGKLVRDKTQGNIKNYLTDHSPTISEGKSLKQSAAIGADGLQEDSIKEILNTWLKKKGWDTKIAWGKTPGIDILATQGHKKWIIEVKGCGSRNAMRVNYFLAILGETLQRMNNADTKYSIALPDLQQYRNLWKKLHGLAKERTQINAIFVSEDGKIVED